MKAIHWLLLALLAMPAFAATPDIRVPAQLHGAELDRAMPKMAREAIARWHDDDRARHLDTLFRLQMVAGQYRAAVESIEIIRSLRGDPGPGQPPLYLQYEIQARAKERQAARGQPFEQAWRDVFAERFGTLDDRTAFRAEYSFGGYLPRMRDDLDVALKKAEGRTDLPLAEAMDLVRKYQVHSSYAAFQPLFAAALAQDDARRYVVDRDALVRTPDGASIAALVVRSVKAPPLPALLQFTIYANDDWAWADAKKTAAHGYAGVVAYSRGKGRSPDVIVPFEHDGADAAAVIDWIATQSWNDGRVGMYGGSYSGFTQWAALKHRPKALKAIATSATTAPGIDVPMEGGIFLNFMYPWPFYTTSNRNLDDARYNDQARWATLNKNGFASGLPYRKLPTLDAEPNPVFARWLQHPSYDGYWQAMIAQGKAFADIDIPVLATTGYFDGAQVGALHYFREHLRQRPGADHTLLIGPYEHFTMQTGVPPVVQGYTLDPVAKIDLQALRLDWFDHVFKGASKPSLLADRVNWQAMGTNAWRHASTLEAMGNGRQRWYLVPGDATDTQRLSTQSQPRASTMQSVDFRDRGDAGWTSSANVVNTHLDPHAGLVFVGEPLQRDIELAGPFSGVLDFVTNKRDVDVVIAVHELDAKGEYMELAYWLQRASYNADRRQRHLLKPGKPQQMVVRDTRLIGRKLAAGSRLVVTLGVIKQPDRQLNLGSGKEPSDETLADAGEPLRVRWQGSSYLDFPVLE